LLPELIQLCSFDDRDVPFVSLVDIIAAAMSRSIPTAGRERRRGDITGSNRLSDRAALRVALPATRRSFMSRAPASVDRSKAALEPARILACRITKKGPHEAGQEDTIRRVRRLSGAVTSS